MAVWLRRTAAFTAGRPAAVDERRSATTPELRALAPLCAGFFFAMLYTYAMQPVRDAAVVVVGRAHLGALTAAGTVASLVVSSAYGAACTPRARGGAAAAVGRTFRLVAAFCAAAAILQLAGGATAGPGGVGPATGDSVPDGPAGAPASPARRLLGACVVVGANAVAPLVLSLLWGFAADTFSPSQAVRLFPYLAAACSMGQFVGSLWAAAWTQAWHHFLGAARVPIPGDTAGLLVCAAASLHCAAECVARVPSAAAAASRAGTGGSSSAQRKGGERRGQTLDADPRRRGLLGAAWMVARSRYLLGICFYTFLYICTGSLVYFVRMARLPAGPEGAAFSARVTARLGLTSAVLVLALQGSGLSSRAIAATGVAFALVLPAAVTLAGFVALAGGHGGLAAVCALDVARRLANYAVAKPVREALFAVVPTEEKYGAKSLIDTAFNRFGSLAATAIFYSPALMGTVAGEAAPAMAGAALAAVWWWVGLFLSRERQRAVVAAAADNG